jgi:guanylate kinase
MSALSGTMFVIAAPSGGGKSTLIRTLREAVPELRFSVSYTTRAPRPGELAGEHYHFIDPTQFQAMIAAGECLEWAEVHGQLYGTGRKATESALAAGVDLILDIDVQGAAQIRRSALPCVSIFILPPNRQTLEQRLTARRSETPESLQRRLADARGEIACATTFDYVVINQYLEAAQQELIAIVRAQRARTSHRVGAIAKVLASFDAARS